MEERTPKKTREAYDKRTLVTTEHNPPRNGDVRIIDSDAYNLAAESFHAGEWKFEGYYAHMDAALKAAMNLTARSAKLGQILTAIESAVERIELNLRAGRCAKGSVNSGD